ncbi:hypothetical protein FQN60_005696, partial [Etheostoma spectabile]
ESYTGTAGHQPEAPQSQTKIQKDADEGADLQLVGGTRHIFYLHHFQCTIQALQDELRIQRDLNQLFQSDYSSGHLGNQTIPPQEMTEENFLRLHSEYERQMKELFLLRKTVEEMELRIDTQKHTLTARDESIKKLLEMLQSKGLSSRATEEDHERTRRLADAEMTIHQLEGLLEQKDKEMLQLRELVAFRTVGRMWDGRIDPRRLKATASARGKHLIPASPSIPISPSFPVSPSISIPPPFHVSPSFQPSPPYSPSRHHQLCSSPSFPAPSPRSHRHSMHPVILPSSCPPHHPSFLVASSVHSSPHHSLQHSPSFPAPAPRPTPAIQPSLHPSPSVAFCPGPRPSPPSLHCSMTPSLPSADHRAVCVSQELHRRYEAAPESTKTKALQTVIEMKDAKISSMERGLRELEEEVNMLKSNGALSSEEREEEIKQMEVYRSHSKFMKNKVEQLKEELTQSQSEKDELRQRANELQREVSSMEQAKQDLSRKDSELLAFRTKLETLNNQFSDSKQHVDVLKESLTAKEQRAAILQTEVDALRLRLEEKESLLAKKSQQISELTEEKSTQHGEISDLKDMLDVKERKVNVLQKKIENLQDQLRDKEKQLGGLKDRTSLLDLKEKASSLASSTLKKDNRLKTLEISLEQKKEECVKLENQLKKARSATADSQASTELSERISCLEQEVTRHKEDAEKAQSEVERLLEILREMENEKNDKEKKIHELESSHESKPLPLLPLSSQWGGWYGTTWAREWL